MKKKKEKEKPFLRFEMVGSRGAWVPRFWIGVQGFSLAERMSKKEAQWMIDMLKIAFVHWVARVGYPVTIDEAHSLLKEAMMGGTIKGDLAKRINVWINKLEAY